MTLKGFDTMYDEPEPSPGSYQHARKVWERKKAEEAEAKKAVDKSLLIIDKPIDLKSTGDDTSTVDQISTVPQMSTVPTIDHKSTVDQISTVDGHVTIENNWLKFDRDILKIMPMLSGAELKVYLYLFSLSFGAWEPKNICHTSYPMISKVAGIPFTSTVSKCINSLIKKGFLKRQFKADAKNELSIYRVFLPCEVPGIEGKTKVTTY
jgi:hypothetical protein